MQWSPYINGVVGTFVLSPDDTVVNAALDPGEPSSFFLPARYSFLVYNVYPYLVHLSGSPEELFDIIISVDGKDIVRENLITITNISNDSSLSTMLVDG